MCSLNGSQFGRLRVYNFKTNQKITSEFLSNEVWELNDLSLLRDELNKVKSSLSDYDIQDWHEHTNLMNPAGGVVRMVRNKFGPELCTQAWCKFYEIISANEDLILEKTRFRSVHLCEAPGAFLSSLNHKIRLTYDRPVDWKWLATSLNPYYEGNDLKRMIDDDRFIVKTLNNWYFGIDNTGDISEMKNLAGLIRESETRLGDVDLVLYFRI